MKFKYLDSHIGKRTSYLISLCIVLFFSLVFPYNGFCQGDKATAVATLVSPDTVADPGAFARAIQLPENLYTSTLDVVEAASTPTYFRLHPSRIADQYFCPVPASRPYPYSSLWLGSVAAAPMDMVYYALSFTVNTNPAYLQTFSAGTPLYDDFFTINVYKPGTAGAADTVLGKWDSVHIALTSDNPTYNLNLDMTDLMTYWRGGDGYGILGDTVGNQLKVSIQRMAGASAAYATGFSLSSSIITIIGTLGVNSAKTLNGNCLAATSVTGTNPVTFNWTDCNKATDYEIQILRLYNTDSNNYNNPTHVNAIVDWSQALTLETNTGQQSITLTLAEGTGYYVWRVREVYTTYPNTIADDRNLGNWSDAGVFNSNGPENITTTVSPYLFYYHQFDDTLNWIYNRQFVEGEVNFGSQPRMGEKTTYADYLLMPLQEQVKTQTGNNILASQTIPDFCGRPVMKTLPAPLGQVGFNYGYNYVTTSTKPIGVYTANNYDQEANFTSPTPISTASKLIAYYSDANSDSTVPSAGGRPYSRTWYYNDGLNREREIATPGGPHYLGGPTNLGAKTVKKFYGKPTQDELIRLFGDEAPDAESITKTYTIDPNSVFNVTYTDPSNKTIATCLSSPQSALLDPIAVLANTNYDTIKQKVPASPSTPITGVRLISNATYTFGVPTTLDFLYNLFPSYYADQCLKFCSSCDYTVYLTARNRDDTDQSAPTVFYDSLKFYGGVSYTGAMALATQSLTHGPAYLIRNTTSLTPGTYDISLSLQLGNDYPGTTRTYLDSAVTLMHAALTTQFTHPGHVVGGSASVYLSNMQAYLAANDIAGLITYTGADTTQPFFYWVVGCDSITLPTAHCYSNTCSHPMFAEYMVSALNTYDSSLTTPFYNVSNISQICDATNNMFTVSSNSAFDNIITAMINDGYNCDSLWTAWKSTVNNFKEGDYTIASATSSTFSAAPKLDWWAYFMSKVGYKHLQVDAAPYSNYALYPYKYFKYNLGSNAALENQVCMLGYSASACSSMTYTSWYPAINNFPTDPGTTPFHMYNFFEIVKATYNTNYTTTSSSSYGSLGNTSGAINMGNATNPGQALLTMQNECYKACDNRLDGLVQDIIQDEMNMQVQVESVFYDTSVHAIRPLSTIDMASIYCMAGNIVQDCRTKCNLTPNADGSIPSAQMAQYQEALVDDIVVQPGPVPGVPPSCSAPWIAATPNPISINAELYLVDYLNHQVAHEHDSLVETGNSNLSTVSVSSLPSSLFGSLSLCNPEIDISASDPNDHFELGVTQVDSAVEPNYTFFRTYPDSALTNADVNIQLSIVITNQNMPAGDSISLNEIPDYMLNVPYAGALDFTVVGPHNIGDTITYNYTVNSNSVSVLGYSDNFSYYSNSGGSTTTTSSGGLTDYTAFASCLTLKYSRGDGAAPLVLCQNSCNMSLPQDCLTGCFKYVNPLTVDTSVHADTTRAITCGELLCKGFTTALNQQIQNLHNKHEAAFRAAYHTNCLTASGVHDLFVNSYSLTQYNYTLYYYDRAGNLVRTVAPQGVAQTGTSRTGATPVNTFLTGYGYNTVGQLIYKTTPDGGQTSYFYDSKGRLRISQSAAQSYLGQYSYTKYDAQSRVIETGQFTGSGAVYIDTPSYPTLGSPGCTSTSFVTTTVYTTPYSGPLSSSLIGAQQFLQNRVSYTYTDRDGSPGTTNDQTWNIYSYDPHGNVATVYNWVSGMPTAAIPVTYGYDLLSNKPTSVNYQSNVNNYLEQFTQNYSYDGDKRLCNVTSTGNAGGVNQEAAYTYYLHGPLKRLVLGANLQGLDYTYTIEGWLKGINHSSLLTPLDPGKDAPANNSVGTDVFGMVLNYYNDGTYKDFSRTSSPFSNSSLTLANGSLYNGNIVSWEQNVYSPTLTSATGYKYRYDQLNRITSTISATNTNIAGWTVDNNYNEAFSYDANGNLQTLTRGNPLSSGLMDNLTYTYTSGMNQVNKIADASTSAIGASSDVPNGNTRYAYDASGEVDTVVAPGGKQNILWRPDGKIDKVLRYTSTGTLLGTISYLYDAMGNRVLSTDVESGINTASYYMRGADGNPLALYQSPVGGGTMTLLERYLYGSERLAIIHGIDKPVQFPSCIVCGGSYVAQLVQPQIIYTFLTLYGYSTHVFSPHPVMTFSTIGRAGIYTMVWVANTPTYSTGWGFGQRNYELHDHLGNVRAVISDTKNSSGNAVVTNYYNYYAFGSMIPGRIGDNSGYRYGFNGQERDDNLNGGTTSGMGIMNYAQFGELDTRVGRRWNMDPKPNASASPYQVFDANPIWISDPLLDSPTVKEAAFIADNVYGADSKGKKADLIDNWKQVDLKIPGVTYHNNNGYDAGLYMRANDDGKTEYVFATRGTESWNDWKNNIEQPLGISGQYKTNAENAVALQKYFGSNTDLTFVGHSLGGGLAAANAMMTNHPAITFNAAGVGPITKAEISNSFGNFAKNLFSPVCRKIDAYVVSGEILNTVQSNMGLKADGSIHKMSVSWLSGYKYDPTGISRHLMGAVKNAVDNEGIK